MLACNTKDTASDTMNDFQAFILIALFAAALYGLVAGCAALGARK